MPATVRLHLKWKSKSADWGSRSDFQPADQNNRTNNNGGDVNFVLPNDTAAQNNEAHQWMGEMIFSYRTSKDGDFAGDNSGFVEVDTNKTLADRRFDNIFKCLRESEG